MNTENVRPKRPFLAWFDVRNSYLGGVAFALNRLTGLALTFYLVLHLLVLRTLTEGAAGWDEFVAIAKTPLFLSLDVVLIFGILFHGLNGLRLVLVGSGFATRQHQQLFWVLMGVGVVLLLVSVWRIFTI